MTVRTVQPLVQTAPRSRRIIGGRIDRGRRRSAWRRRAWLVARRGRICRVRCGLFVGNEVLVAGSTRPRRQLGRFASSPVRPIIGNRARNLGASPENEAEAQRHQRPGVPIESHATHWVIPGSMGDGLISWRDCDVPPVSAAGRPNI
jgi:hypothetical protein